MTRSDLSRLRTARRARKATPALFACTAAGLAAWMAYRLRCQWQARRARFARFAHDRPAPMPRRHPTLTTS